LRQTKKPFMIAFVGISGSGKTASMGYLTQQLTGLGFNVGVAKHIHEEGFTIDTEGKDTWRHAHAGARVVIGASPNELAIMKKTTSEAKFGEIERKLRGEDLDVALLEGFSTASKGIANLPKVITAKDARDLNRTLRWTKPPILAITGRVTRRSKRLGKVPAPLVDMKHEGFLLTSMVRRILRPSEMKDMLKKAAKRHGDECIGLAVGIRAAYLASCVFGQEGSGPERIVCGTKHCIAEAFQTIYPKSRVQVTGVRDDRIIIRSMGKTLLLKLTPRQKANFLDTSQVLKAPDKVLFEAAKLT